MRKNPYKISYKYSTLHLYCVNKRKCVCNLLKSTSYKVKIKPNTRQPR